jgi:conjugative transposon TraN protein
MKRTFFLYLISQIALANIYAQTSNSKITYKKSLAKNTISEVVLTPEQKITLNTEEIPLPPVNTATATINAGNIVSYRVAQDKTTHIISPEPILYVDISSPDIEGDMPTKNLLRFKPSELAAIGKQFQVTVVTEQYVMAYKMILTKNDPEEATIITIKPDEAIPTNSYNKVGKNEFDRLAMLALSKKRTINNVKNEENGIDVHVNNIYIVGDFLLFDVGIENKTRLPYDVDQVRFKLTDKKRVASQSSQEIEITPVYQLYPNDGTTVTKKWRNFYMFRKFTYPEEKVFNIELAEKQLSGRQISVNVDYKKVLNSEFLQ